MTPEEYAAIHARLDEFRGQVSKHLFNMVAKYYPDLWGDATGPHRWVEALDRDTYLKARPEPSQPDTGGV